jgi:hypothetical protein
LIGIYSSAMGPLDKEILDKASDNDGLWEFVYIGGQLTRDPDDPDDPEIEGISPNPEAFRDLHQRMIGLVEAGYITIRASPFREDMSVGDAVAVLADAENWVLPWERGGAWETKSDAYCVRLTPVGEAALGG